MHTYTDCTDVYIYVLVYMYIHICIQAFYNVIVPTRLKPFMSKKHPDVLSQSIQTLSLWS